MTIIEQLVEDYKRQNPSATPEQIKEYIQTLEPHTKVIKEDEWAFNTEHDDGIKIPDDINVSATDETFTSGSDAHVDADVNTGNRTSV
jgi:hypothetical protein